MTFANSFATRQHYRNISESEMRTSRSNLANLARNARTGKAVHMTGPALRDLLYAVGSGIIREKTVDAEAIHHVVFLPVQMLTADAVSVGVEVWSWIIAQRPTAEHKVMAEIVTAMSWTLHKRKGVFSTSMKCVRLRSLRFAYWY